MTVVTLHLSHIFSLTTLSCLLKARTSLLIRLPRSFLLLILISGLLTSALLLGSRNPSRFSYISLFGCFSCRLALILKNKVPLNISKGLYRLVVSHIDLHIFPAGWQRSDDSLYLLFICEVMTSGS